MSFEYDENRLTNPPPKCDAQAVPAFWGIYQWPHKNYNRYAQLSHLEQRADETRTMAKALRYISTAQELGLSLDGGLGWLHGPDKNLLVSERNARPVVFGGSRFEPEPKPASVPDERFDATPASPKVTDPSHVSFHRMLREIGFQGQALSDAQRLMIQTDNMSDLEIPSLSISSICDQIHAAQAFQTPPLLAPRHHDPLQPASHWIDVELANPATEQNDAKEVSKPQSIYAYAISLSNHNTGCRVCVPS